MIVVIFSPVQKRRVKSFGSISTAASNYILFFHKWHIGNSLVFKQWELLPKEIDTITTVIWKSWVFIASIISEICLLLIWQMFSGVLYTYLLLNFRTICNLYRRLFIKLQYNRLCNCLLPGKSVEEWVPEEQLFVDYKAAASTGRTARRGFIFIVFGFYIEDIIIICSLEILTPSACLVVQACCLFMNRNKFSCIRVVVIPLDPPFLIVSNIFSNFEMTFNYLFQ